MASRKKNLEDYVYILIFISLLLVGISLVLLILVGINSSERDAYKDLALVYCEIGVSQYEIMDSLGTIDEIYELTGTRLEPFNCDSFLEENDKKWRMIRNE